MHELSTCRSLLKKVEQIAREQNAIKIKAITLQNGYFSTVDVNEVVELFPQVAKGTMAEGVKIVVYQQQLEARCADCHRTFLVDTLLEVCPYCRSGTVATNAEQGLIISSIDVTR